MPAARQGLPYRALLMLLLLSGCTGPAHRPSEADATYRTEVTAGLEEIFVTRTTRTLYVRGGTLACAAAPFVAASEQHYDDWSLDIRGDDARVVRTHVARVGGFTACFGPVQTGGRFPLYARGRIGSLGYTAMGECRFMKSKSPAAGLLVLTCSADLSGLPEGYAGGYLTTSSLATAGGTKALPVRGYLSTSVITMRLWKAPH